MQKEYIQHLFINKILLDSNTYFRLADNIYPLLSKTFGKRIKYDLKILGGTLREYNYQARLQSKFSWVDSDRHKEDRKRNKLRLKKPEQEKIKRTQQFIQSESVSRGIGCSSFDIECLVTAMEMNYTLVTDDGDLYDLAQEYEVPCISTLDLLKLMLNEERITMKDIQNTVYMWDYIKDLPRNFYSDFKSIFGVEPESYP